jgi:Tfp pilus assembly protein PilF
VTAHRRFALALALLCACAVPTQKELERAETHRELAALKLSRSDFPYAIREYRAAIELNERDPELHFGLGEAYRGINSYAEAEAQFRRALALDPAHQDSLLNLCVVHLQQQRWADAIADADALLADPTFLNPARGYVNRAWAHYQLHQLQAAEADLREALRRDGGSFQAHLNLGIVLFERGDLAGAMGSLKRVVGLLERYQNPAYACAEAEARVRLAKAYVKLGDRKSALDQLERAGSAPESCRWHDEAQEDLAALS